MTVKPSRETGLLKCLKYREKLVAELLLCVTWELTKHLHLPKCSTFWSMQTYSKIITETECQDSSDIIHGTYNVCENTQIRLEHQPLGN